ncbi:fungal specific transcription factor domain-containing protein [Sarocladium implicatum]|nr:fungal specific transcription factor domain-containing protein [Sarocladium implicatum]
MVDTNGGSPVTTRRKRVRQEQQTTPRNPRLRLACARCQRRKIKCGGEIPACKNCENAGVACVDGESAKLRDLPRSYIGGLQSRVKWLESIIRERCPDIDLTEGPTVAGSSSPGLANAPTAIDEATLSPETSLPPVSTDLVNANSNPMLGGTNALSHEIGLVSLGTNEDQRYIGPSSGFFLARVMLTKPTSNNAGVSLGRDDALPRELVEAVHGPLPLPSREAALKMIEPYFEYIHPQYPILHRPTFESMLSSVYEDDVSDHTILFQVKMVLAIGATVVSSRSKARIPGESYCLAAMEHFEHLNVENSLQGLQGLVLLFVFTIHNPYMRLNVWYLNYQCIAALLDIGLQRNITVQSGISLLEQEIRARVFWVIFMLDRQIATMMGRPIGIRDEACELRFPEGYDDIVLSPGSSVPVGEAPTGISQMAYSVHLFRLAKLNSEIKYVANSVVSGSPNYAYPAIVDIKEWQRSMLHQLDQWALAIPKDGDAGTFMYLNCQIRYHCLRMVLLRPSPNIPKAETDSLVKCHESARSALRLMDRMYRKNCLTHSWFTFYSLVLSTLTMLYCIKTVPEVSRNVRLEVLMMDLGSAMSMLSATGEHWSGAKRSRDILDELGKSTVRWLQSAPQGNDNMVNVTVAQQQTGVAPNQGLSGSTIPSIVETSANPTIAPFMSTNNILGDGFGFVSPPSGDFFSFEGLPDFFDTNAAGNVDSIVENLFQGFIAPQYPYFT